MKPIRLYGTFFLIFLVTFRLIDWIVGNPISLKFELPVAFFAAGVAYAVIKLGDPVV